MSWSTIAERMRALNAFPDGRSDTVAATPSACPKVPSLLQFAAELSVEAVASPEVVARGRRCGR